MARGRVILDKIGIREDANKLARAEVKRGGRKVLNRSAILCPVDTGRLRAAGRIKLKELSRGPVAVVEYPVSYAAAVHDGTRPHIIRARRGKALRFMVDGQFVFATAVRHPGTQPAPFLRRAGQEVAAAEGWRFIRRG